MRLLELPQLLFLSLTWTDAAMAVRLTIARCAMMALAFPGLSLAHDLQGIDSEQQLILLNPPALFSSTAQLGDIPPALAQQVARARDVKQAFEMLFPNGAEQSSYLAQLMAEGKFPYSVFIPIGKWKVGTTLKVCFHSDGGQNAKQRIAKHAREWSKYGEIYFDFGKEPDLNFCDFNDGAQIRISFRQKGYFSLIGNEAMLSDRTNGVTMGLQDLDTGRYPIDGEKFKAIVIHEFGHAIGLAHEHQHPGVDCFKQFDVEAIKREYAWNDAKVTTNLKMLEVSSVTAAGKFYKTGVGANNVIFEYSNEPDPDSVMRYDLRKEDFTQPPGSCYDPTTNSEPSKGDREAISRAYPRSNPAKQIQMNNALIENTMKKHPNLTSLEKAALQVFRR